MNVEDLNIRVSSKKALQRVSKNAERFDFVVKTGIKQDDLGFMSILDIPISDPGSGKSITLGEYLTYLGDLDTAIKILDKELD